MRSVSYVSSQHSARINQQGSSAARWNGRQVYSQLGLPDQLSTVRLQNLMGNVLGNIQRPSSFSFSPARTVGDLITAKVGGTTEMSKVDLLVKAIEIDHRCDSAYCQLALILSPDEKIVFSDGREMNQLELFVAAITLNPRCSDYFFQLALCLHLSGQTSIVIDQTTYAIDMLLFRVISFDPHSSPAYDLLGVITPAHHSRVLPDGRWMKKEALFIESIKSDSSNSNPYRHLAQCLSHYKRVRFYHGVQMNSIECAVKAIQLAPTYAPGYCILGSLLLPGTHVQLFDGRVVTSKELFLEANRLNPQFLEVYWRLASILVDQEVVEVKLPDQRKAKVKALNLLFYSISKNPKDANPYFYLARLLLDGKIPYLISTNQEEITPRELLLIAIHLDPQFVEAYDLLEKNMLIHEVIQFYDGTQGTKLQLIQKGLEFSNNTGL